MLLPFKGYLHTLTFDNGREFAHHEKISEALGISIFLTSSMRHPIFSIGFKCVKKWLDGHMLLCQEEGF